MRQRYRPGQGIDPAQAMQGLAGLGPGGMAQPGPGAGGPMMGLGGPPPFPGGGPGPMMPGDGDEAGGSMLADHLMALLGGGEGAGPGAGGGGGMPIPGLGTAEGMVGYDPSQGGVPDLESLLALLSLGQSQSGLSRGPVNPSLGFDGGSAPMGNGNGGL